jgi:hypothetical protein
MCSPFLHGLVKHDHLPACATQQIRGFDARVHCLMRDANTPQNLRVVKTLIVLASRPP